jgi:hypothetical protein
VIRQQLATTRRLLASAIKHAQQRGVLKANLDPDEAAALLVMLRLGLLASWFSDPGSFDLAKFTQSFIRVLLPCSLPRKLPRSRRLTPHRTSDLIAKLDRAANYS